MSGRGRTIDTEPLQPWEWEALQPHLAPHWRLYFRVLWETGIRPGEALALKRQDLVDTAEGPALRVQRLKTGARRDRRPQVDLVLISVELAQALRAHPGSKRRAPFFPHTLRAARYALAAAAANAGLRPTLHPHLFRHGFGRRVARLPLAPTELEHRQLLARMLGHSSTQHVGRYIRPGPEEVLAAWAALRRAEAAGGEGGSPPAPPLPGSAPAPARAPMSTPGPEDLRGLLARLASALGVDRQRR